MRIGTLSALGTVLALAACSQKGGDSQQGTAPTNRNATVAAPDAQAQTVADAPKDAGITDAQTAIADAGWDGPRIGALFMQTPVMSDMEWPKEKDEGKKDRVVRLGYIRHGAKVPVIPEPHKKANCNEGWYELVAGGFVCGKYATLDLNHPRIKAAPKQPDLSGQLPYQYGYNTTNGTPLYRQVPSREARARLEPWLAPRKRPKKPAPAASASADEETADNSAAPDAGLQPVAQRVAEDETPWWQRDYDGGRPMVTLDDLKGEGPVSRRMVKGFYLSLDHSFGSAGAQWWKTQSGFIAPFDRVWVQKPLTDFHGVWLNDKEGGAPPKNPAAGVGFVLWSKAKKYTLSADHKKVTTGESVPRFSIARLTGEKAVIAGTAYEETEDGWWMKANEGTRTKPQDAPKDLQPGEKWVDVNLTTQTLVAFEGDKPVYATLVSTGRRSPEKEKDHPTPTGTFRIREKHIAATMDGDGAADGPYSIEDVPWIMYFNGSYALHGAFWHANFGHVQSHGCVNLSPGDAKAMFNWTEPRVPEGWHGSMSTPEKPGTRVVVHD
jgi:lipoprotein-anchoring transpeptidase ErfK/SrfK